MFNVKNKWINEIGMMSKYMFRFIAFSILPVKERSKMEWKLNNFTLKAHNLHARTQTHTASKYRIRNYVFAQNAIYNLSNKKFASVLFI